jgi:protein-disulfide isomerase
MTFRSSALAAVILGFAIMAHVTIAQAQNRTAPQSQPANAGPNDLSPAAASAIQKRVELYLRNLYAWGPSFEVKAGPVTASPLKGLYQVSVTVTEQGQSDSAVVYVSADGRYMVRGEIQDLNTDPLAATREQLHLDGYASKGPADARVILVEFADFECPSCRQLDQVLRAILPKYPQVRLVFKDFPLEQIHPWAMTAAVAGRCVLQQSSEIFWKFHDSVYDQQELISPENASTKLADLAAMAGAKPTEFGACMTDPKTPDAVRKSLDEGHMVQVSWTPTTFIDGRRIVGPDAALIEQYIQFDSTTPSPKP